MFLISMAKSFLLSCTRMETWAVWKVPQLKLDSVHAKHHCPIIMGKSHELVSFAAQQPDATVFQPSGSEIKPVGKISRRICLVRYPEPEELAKPNFGGLTPSSKISAVSSRKTKSRFTSASKNRSSQGSARSLGQWSAEPTPKHKQKRKDESSQGHSNLSGKASQGSQAGAESNTTSEKPVFITEIEEGKEG